jgi:hypothetical protein
MQVGASLLANPTDGTNTYVDFAGIEDWNSAPNINQAMKCYLATNVTNTTGLQVTGNHTASAGNADECAIACVEIKNADTTDAKCHATGDWDTSADWGTGADGVETTGCCDITPSEDNCAQICGYYRSTYDVTNTIDAGTTYNDLVVVGPTNQEQLALVGYVQGTATEEHCRLTQSATGAGFVAHNAVAP